MHNTGLASFQGANEIIQMIIFFKRRFSCGSWFLYVLKNIYKLTKVRGGGNFTNSFEKFEKHRHKAKTVNKYVGRFVANPVYLSVLILKYTLAPL